MNSVCGFGNQKQISLSYSQEENLGSGHKKVMILVWGTKCILTCLGVGWSPSLRPLSARITEECFWEEHNATSLHKIWTKTVLIGCDVRHWYGSLINYLMVNFSLKLSAHTWHWVIFLVHTYSLPIEYIYIMYILTRRLSKTFEGKWKWDFQKKPACFYL